MGQLAHDIRDGLNTALIAFNVVKGGSVSITGNTGAVLGRSLLSLRDLVDSSLSGTRIAANHQRRERLSLTAFLSEIAVAARLHSGTAEWCLKFTRLMRNCLSMRTLSCSRPPS